MTITPEERRKQTGQQAGERVVAYKLNEIKMSGDDGKFSIREVLSDKNEEGHYPTKELGDHVDAVILKMRWRLTRYEEIPGGKSIYYMTSEYDNKNTDKVVLFNTMEKGLALDLKEKYNLGSQRVIYAYIPALKQICRIIVKASGLSGDKNPNKEFGLFEYVDTFTESETFIDDFVTHISSVYREDEKNKRKSYYATTFSLGRELTDTEKEKVGAMRSEVHQKTSANKSFADEYVESQESVNDSPDEVLDDSGIPF